MLVFFCGFSNFFYRFLNYLKMYERIISSALCKKKAGLKEIVRLKKKQLYES